MLFSVVGKVRTERQKTQVQVSDGSFDKVMFYSAATAIPRNQRLDGAISWNLVLLPRGWLQGKAGFS